VQQAQRGVKGIVTNRITGKPIPNANIGLTDRENYVNTTLNGEYWKILLPGVYKLRVSKEKIPEFWYGEMGLKALKDLHQSLGSCIHSLIL